MDRLYVSLHTDNPEHGNQATHEADYVFYQRVRLWIDPPKLIKSPILRRLLGWAPIKPPSVDFPMAGHGPDCLVRYFGLGTEPSGPGRLLHSGGCYPSIQISALVMARIFPEQEAIDAAFKELADG